MRGPVESCTAIVGKIVFPRPDGDLGAGRETEFGEDVADLGRDGPLGGE